MTTFHDVRLPDSVEQGSSGGPGFQTSVVVLNSGNEQRNIDWQKARRKYDISYGIDEDTFPMVIDFFNARRGRGYGFRFKDWSDFKLDAEPIGIGDGANALFQIIKTYEASGPLPYLRSITRPVADTLSVTVGGVAEVHYTLGDLGVITFTAGHEPANTAVVAVTCEFDVPVRFDSDDLSVSMQQATAGAVQSIYIVELRDE